MLRPHPAGHQFGAAEATPAAGNLLIQGDNLEPSQWLTMMLPRLQLLRELPAEVGSFWVTIDDDEGN